MSDTTTAPVSTSIETYTNAANQIDLMNLPILYDASNINSRVFIALADGTENMVNNSTYGSNTNIGILRNQLQDLLANHSMPAINFGYVSRSHSPEWECIQ